MIVKAKDQDKAVLYKFWKEYFAFDDGGSIDFYFNNIFNINNCFLIKEKDEIVSALMSHKHIISLHNKKIETSLISGIFTNEKYRHQGYMRRLLSTVLNELAHQELITLIQAYDNNIYLPYGFKPVYYKKSYTIEKHKNNLGEYKNISKEYSVSQLAQVYKYFMERFTGYYLRHTEDFSLYLKELAAEKAQVIVYKEADTILGYIVYYDYLTYINVSEVVYLTKSALVNMISYLFTKNSKLIVNVSQAENLERLFITEEAETSCFMMARLNDVSLFNSLYQSNISDINEAMRVSGLPLSINEYW